MADSDYGALNFFASGSEDGDGAEPQDNLHSEDDDTDGGPEDGEDHEAKKARLDWTMVGVKSSQEEVDAWV